MEKKEIIYFIQKILKGTASREEETKVDQHFQDAFREEGWNQEKYGDRARTYRRISSSVTERVKPIGTFNIKRKKQSLVRYAASVVLLLSAIGGIYYYVKETKESHLATASRTTEMLNPGIEKAALELSNGARLDLNEIQVGETVLEPGVIVTKSEEGNVTYVFDSSGAAREELTWNTLTTPIGGKYQLTLVDGTKVWLNSASSIRFPPRFERNQRAVTVSGEVYFEVAHDASRPFLVSAEGLELQVLGTRFNVSTYSNDEEEIAPSVALVEGAVRLNLGERGSKVLSPGQKATVRTTGLDIERFDAEAEIAWKDNYFIFKDSNIKVIMSALARWYDAEVVYVGEEWQDKTFTIRMSRRENIEEILSILALTKAIEFNIEGRRVTVYSR